MKQGIINGWFVIDTDNARYGIKKHKEVVFLKEIDNLERSERTLVIDESILRKLLNEVTE